MLLNVLSLVQVFAWLKTSKGFKASADTLLKGPTLMAENQDGLWLVQTRKKHSNFKKLPTSYQSADALWAQSGPLSRD